MSTPPEPATPAGEGGGARGRGGVLRFAPWLIAALCFGYLYSRLAGAAAREGLSLFEYLGGTFARVNWGAWLALMVPYSFLFFLVDSAVVWRVVNWFNARVSYRDMLPIRGSSYILSILNEQVGKGAMGLYLNRRHGVPGWEVGSSMIFIMFCEFFYLLAWATIGTFMLTGGDRLPEVSSAWIPVIFSRRLPSSSMLCGSSSSAGRSSASALGAAGSAALQGVPRSALVRALPGTIVC